MKLVIDTNIYISAFAFGGQPSEIIQKIADNPTHFEVFTCTQLWQEVETKFFNGRLAQILKNNFQIDEAKEYLQGILDGSIFVEVRPEKRSISRDAKDDILLFLAHKAEVDFIVTRDKDLLVLKEFENTKIVAVHEFLQILGE